MYCKADKYQSKHIFGGVIGNPVRVFAHFAHGIALVISCGLLRGYRGRPRLL